MNLEILITDAKRPKNGSLPIMTVNRGIQSCIFFFWHVANIQIICGLNVYTNIFNNY